MRNECELMNGFPLPMCISEIQLAVGGQREKVESLSPISILFKRLWKLVHNLFDFSAEIKCSPEGSRPGTVRYLRSKLC